MSRTSRTLWVLLPIALAVTPGCATPGEWDRFWKQFQGDTDGQPEAGSRPISDNPAVRDTVAPLVTLQGAQLNQVRGYGLVVDLVDTGGRDGPQPVKDYLVKEIRRRQEIGHPGLPPLDILNSRDSAMVELNGYIPAAAKKGDRFDVEVTALGGETRSLAGGRLVLGELKVYALTPSGVLAGETLATVGGPVFVSPFNRRGRPTDTIDLRRGVVLGGGVVKEDRRLRLILNNPSYSDAKRIEQRINSRFARDDPIAIGESAGIVGLKIPPEYHNRKPLFLERILHTSLLPDPGQPQRALLRALEEPEADYNGVGLGLESIGKIVLPDLRRLYESSSANTRFYAARTGLRLEDRNAAPVIVEHALKPDSPFRNEAIHELGWARRVYQAGETLRKLLDDEDDEIRITAYRALRLRSHPAIETKVLDVDNMILDVVDSTGPFLIYVQRMNEPRVAVFGKSLRCNPPAIFPASRQDGRVLLTQLSAETGAEHLTFIFKNKHNGLNSPPMNAPLNVAELISYLADEPHRDAKDQVISGYAVPYSEIIDILSAFCDLGTIPARFVLEGLEDADEKAPQEREESEF